MPNGIGDDDTTYFTGEDSMEKIEVSKDNGNFFYTGTLRNLDDGWVEINTTRGETLKFRKEQIMMRRLITE